MGKPKVPEQKPTAQEIAQFEISHQDKWNDHQQYGIPAQDAMIRQTTGYVLNPDTGRYEIDPAAGVLHADGSVRTDAGREIARAQKQWQPLLQGINPNTGRGRTGRVGLLQDKMASDAQIEAGTRFGQQNTYLQALQDTIGIGRGQQADLISANQHMAGMAAQQAGQDARTSFQNRLGNQQAIGTLIGAGGSYLMNQVPVVRPDGGYIRGAYDTAFKGFLGGL